jgi:hypothetical protein
LVSISNFYRRNSLAVSTQKAYKAGVKSYIEYCTTRLQLSEQQIWPPNETTIEQWLSWLAAFKRRSYGTISNYLIGVNTYTQDGGYSLSTSNSYRINKTLEGIKRTTGIKPRLIREPLTTSLLRHKIEPILSQQSIRSYEETLNWAALCTGTFGLMRAGEIAQSPSSRRIGVKSILLQSVTAWSITNQPIQLRYNEIASSKLYYFILHLPRSKADKYGKGENITISNSTAVKALQAYLQCHPQLQSSSETPLFINEDTSPYKVEQLVEGMRSLLKQAGVPNSNQYYGHSMRKGGAQSLRELSGITNEQIKTAGRWSSDSHEAYHTTPLNEHIKLNCRF